MPYELHTAAADKNGFDTVKKLIQENKVQVDLLDDQERRAVDCAAYSGSLATLRFLIEEAKADIRSVTDMTGLEYRNLMFQASSNTPDVMAYVTDPQTQLYKKFQDGTTDLLVAACAGRLEEMQAILAKDPSRIHEVNHQGKGVLYWAILGNRQDITQYLLALNINFNKSTNHLSPLAFAASQKRLDMVKFLLSLGENPRWVAEGGLHKGDTSLTLAAMMGHSDIVQTLIEAKANPKELIAEGDLAGSGPIHLAALYGHLATVQTLVAAKVDPHVPAKNNRCFAPIHLAAEMERLPLLQYLLQIKVNPEQCVIGGEYDGWAPIHLAANYGRLSVIQALLEAKVDPNAPAERTCLGCPPIYFAAVNGKPTAVQTLLAAKAHLHEPTKRGKITGFAPIHYAAMSNFPDVVQTLLEAKADPNHLIKEGNKLGYTPIHIAAAYGKNATLQAFLAAKCDPNTPIKVGNNKDFSPLYLAIGAGNAAVVQTLLDIKVNPNDLIRIMGTAITPLAVATQLGETSIVQMLLKAKANPDDPVYLKGQKHPLFEDHVSPLAPIAPSSSHSPPSSPPPPKEKGTGLTRAIDAVFSTGNAASAKDFVFDKSAQSDFRNYLRSKCKEKSIFLAKDKLNLIMNELRGKVSDAGKIAGQEVAALIKKHLYPEKSVTPSVSASLETKEEALKTIADKYDAFEELKTTINALITDFDQSHATCDDVTIDWLPSKQLKAAFASCKGLLARHETNKKYFTRLQSKCSLTQDALASSENLKTMDKLIEEARLLQTEIANTTSTFKKEKDALMCELKGHKDSDKKVDKKGGKTAAILAALKSKKEQKETEKQKEKERRHQSAKKEQKLDRSPGDRREPGLGRKAQQEICAFDPPELVQKSGPAAPPGFPSVTRATVTEQKSATKSGKEPSTRQRKLKILGGAVHHLLCIGILAADYIELLAEKEESKAEKSAQKKLKIETLHFALLYNISRCFQALKIYKQFEQYSQTTQTALKQISKDLLEDLRNMILKLGALDADKSLVLDTAKKLAQFLPRSLCEMRKEYLTVPVLNDEQINDLVNVFGLVKDPERFELDAFPIPLDELPLYQQLAQCHDRKKVAQLTPLEIENKIWLKAIPIIKQIMGSIIKVYPQAPLPKRPGDASATSSDDGHFNEYFWREIQALKMLSSSCGVPYPSGECRRRIGLVKKAKGKLQESTEPTIKFYEFLAFCRTHITNPVGHVFETSTDFFNYDVVVEKIYRACFMAEGLVDKPYFGALPDISSRAKSKDSKQVVAALVSRKKVISVGETTAHQDSALQNCDSSVGARLGSS